MFLSGKIINDHDFSELLDDKQLDWYLKIEKNITDIRHNEIIDLNIMRTEIYHNVYDEVKEEVLTEEKGFITFDEDLELLLEILSHEKFMSVLAYCFYFGDNKEITLDEILVFKSNQRNWTIKRLIADLIVKSKVRQYVNIVWKIENKTLS